MKNIKGTIRILDQIEVIVRDKDGKVKSRHILNNGRFHKFLCKLGLRHNSMNNTGFANVAGLLLTDVGGIAYDYVAIGTGVIAADPTDVELGTQKGVRQAGTGTLVTTGGITHNTAQLVATFSQAIDATLTGADAITEVGVFYDAADVTVSMLLRQVYTPSDYCDWDQGDTMQVTVKVQVKQG